MSKPRVAILTSLADYSPAYSLVGIILDQCRMLKRHGYDYDLLCLRRAAFNMREYGAEEITKELSVRYIMPQTVLHDYQPNEKAKEAHKDASGNLVQGFEQQVATYFNGDAERKMVGYKDALADYDVIIDHDLMFLSWHLPQNAALRQCINLWPEKTWIHWVHSGPSHRPADVCYPSTLRYSQAPHSTYVYLNHRQKHDYALMIGAPDKDVAVVYNPKDVRDVWEFDELTRDLISRYDLLDHQVLEVYPFSTPRWVDKGVKQLIRVFGFWKKAGVKAKLVLVNAHCNSSRDKADVDGIEAYAEVCGLELDKDVILTSRYADEQEMPKLRYTVPFKTVRELVMISNLFIFPSASECCSLIQAEASMAGKFMVLNRDFAPMLEFCTNNVLHFEFTRNNPDANPVYYECVAREVWANLSAEASIMNRTEAITKTYNSDWIFRNQFEPLLYLNASESASATRKNRPKKEPLEAERVRKPTSLPQPISVETPGGEEIPVSVTVDEEDLAETARQMREARPGSTIPKIISYENPFPGMPCEIYGECSEKQSAKCFAEAGHCLMLDEIDHEARKAEAAEKKK